MKKRLTLMVAVFSVAALAIGISSAQAATLTVNTTDVVDDSACTASHCSLREAFNAANRFSDTDTINFNIGGGGQQTIRVTHLLRLLFPVIIDGTTQPGYAGKPIVELDGSLSTVVGLEFGQSSGGSTVRGLVINSFNGTGITLGTSGFEAPTPGPSGNYRIEGNYIGTDVTGTLARANRNEGILVHHGVSVDNGRNTIVRNVISANRLNGITIAADEDENVVQGNNIGTNASGTAALGNGRWGIRILGPSADNLIGGTAAGAGNVISGNGDDGIAIHGAVASAFTGNVVQGNYIGTNASGTAALENRINGILTNGNNTTIGGTVPGARNIISGNGWNGIIIGGRSTGTVVQGNLIGTAVDGTTALGNGLALSLNRDSGIDASFAIETTIGGTAPGAANTIAYSTGPGVIVGASTNDPTFSRNGILSNSIFSNGGLGIDLNPRGVNPNDPGDADRGPNERQNFPVLTSASGNTVAGTLNTTPNTTFRLEFFANTVADPSGHGEGERFLGATNVTTDGSGNASFSFVSSIPLPSGQFVSSTATDPANNTSEFSRVVLVTGQASLTLSPPTATNKAGDQHCVTATVRDAAGNPVAGVLVRFSVSGANTASGSDTTDSSGEATFCYTGTNTGSDTISAFADVNTNGTDDGTSEPDGMASKTYVAAAPATLDLTPATATNPVASQHCVSAHVEDAFGNPAPGITVRFSTSGSTSSGGSAATNSTGDARFCYTGPAVPGADTIRAFADTDNDGTDDGASEPDDSAQKTWVAPAGTTGCKITDGGRITANNGDKATFGANAHETTPPKGQQNYQDHGPAQPVHVKSTRITSVTCSPDRKRASIFGTATINGAGIFEYRIDVQDLGEPGTNDTYRIRLSSGYDSGEKTLEGGNIQIHK